MGPLCDCSCAENINKLNQQVSVMRKEIKNLRQMLDAAVRAHRKHIVSVQNMLKFGSCEKMKDQRPSSPHSSPQAALEQGNIQTMPIGYIRSCFSVKNGTPRQPGVCGPSRAELTIQKSVFNNPEHALVGLDQYSHVWIIFLFHKNGHLSYKSKVKPPRLNGQRVGVYSTRSPHRPNALGLTLAKLDKTEGDTLHLSEIDMIDGTPVMDIKPYIPEYDSPDTRRSLNLQQYEFNTAGSVNKDILKLDDDDGEILPPMDKSNMNISFTNTQSVEVQCFLPKETCSVLEEVKAFLAQDDTSKHDCKNENRVLKPKELSVTTEHPCYGEEACATIASWIRAPPVSCLDVRFTPHAERQLAEFLPAHLSEPSESNRPRFKFLCSPEEAVAAIRGVLSADPRSVYRRTRCTDKLFFFTIDTADITCWFGQGFVEVLQVQPVERRDSSV